MPKSVKPPVVVVVRSVVLKFTEELPQEEQDCSIFVIVLGVVRTSLGGIEASTICIRAIISDFPHTCSRECRKEPHRDKEPRGVSLAFELRSKIIWTTQGCQIDAHDVARRHARGREVRQCCASVYHGSTRYRNTRRVDVV